MSLSKPSFGGDFSCEPRQGGNSGRTMRQSLFDAQSITDATVAVKFRGVQRKGEQRSRDHHSPALLSRDRGRGYFLLSSVSMALVTSADSGSTFDSKRATISPLRPIKNLVKFHLISPLNLGSVSLEVRYLYSGTCSAPLTGTLLSISNLTPYFDWQNLAI